MAHDLRILRHVHGLFRQRPGRCFTAVLHSEDVYKRQVIGFVLFCGEIAKPGFDAGGVIHSKTSTYGVSRFLTRSLSAVAYNFCRFFGPRI